MTAAARLVAVEVEAVGELWAAARTMAAAARLVAVEVEAVGEGAAAAAVVP
jgi:hypothetical protein